MTDVLFYHLTERTLEQTLPGLLEKCAERGWRAVVQGGVPERLQALDEQLWTYREDSFLGHSAARDGNESEQPVFLTDAADNPNDAAVRFLIDGAVPPDLSGYERGIYIFDGYDTAAVEAARARWKAEQTAGHAVTYWQQRPDGGWEKKA